MWENVYKKRELMFPLCVYICMKQNHRKRYKL